MAEVGRVIVNGYEVSFGEMRNLLKLIVVMIARPCGFIRIIDEYT